MFSATLQVFAELGGVVKCFTSDHCKKKNTHSITKKHVRTSVLNLCYKTHRHTNQKQNHVLCAHLEKKIVLSHFQEDFICVLFYESKASAANRNVRCLAIKNNNTQDSAAVLLDVQLHQHHMQLMFLFPVPQWQFWHLGWHFWPFTLQRHPPLVSPGPLQTETCY